MLTSRFKTPLRAVDPSSIRDGSAPVLNGEQDSSAERYEDARPFNHAFLNRPREGDTIDTRFWLEYINGATLDGKLRVLLRYDKAAAADDAAGVGAGAGSAEIVLANELEKDANGLRWHLTRRDDLDPGSYSAIHAIVDPMASLTAPLSVTSALVVQKQVKDGSFVDDAATEVLVA